MTKYEIREGNTTTQFLTFQEAEAYSPNAEVFVVEENFEFYNEPNKDNWHNFEQDLYTSALFSKGLTSQGNGFALLLKVLTDGSTKGASQNALLMAIQATIAGISNFTQQDKNYLNEYLISNNFTIQI